MKLFFVLLQGHDPLEKFYLVNSIFPNRFDSKVKKSLKLSLKQITYF